MTTPTGQRGNYSNRSHKLPQAPQHLNGFHVMSSHVDGGHGSGEGCVRDTAGNPWLTADGADVGQVP